MILVIDNYDSFTYNLYQMIEEIGATCEVRRNDELTCDEIERLDPRHIVISPGPGRPEESGISLEVIDRFGGRVPILGVCLGHQGIATVFGGNVVRAPEPQHGKCSRVFHDQKGIFSGVESPFLAARYHSLIVERASMPSCLEVSSETDTGLVMGLRHRSLPIEGVQFHPESMATEGGRRLLQNFLQMPM